MNELEGVKEAGERLVEAREELNDVEDQLKHSKALAKAVMQDPCSCEKNCSLGKCGKGKRPCTPHCGKGESHLHRRYNPTRRLALEWRRRTRLARVSLASDAHPRER
jgi:hypothetical protein